MNKNERQSWIAAAWDMLYLIRCAVLVQIPEISRVDKMDFEKVYKLSRRQSLEAMTYLALEPLIINKESFVLKDGTRQILKEWNEAKEKVIRNTLLINAARNQLFSYLEKNKIWHLPLKGIVLAEMYPQFGMRQMADNDILFDASYRQEVHDWFVGKGYTVIYYKEMYHDVYHKLPVYAFEMHTSLFKEMTRSQLSWYSEMKKNRLQSIPGKKYEYRMSKEDFYLYMLIHMYEDYSDGGTGLRSLLDLYIHQKANFDMDRSYLDSELKKIGLYDFEKTMRGLSQKVFSLDFDADTLTEEEKNIFRELLFGTTYGTMEKHWRNQLKNAQPDRDKISVITKIKYFFRRILPYRKNMEIWCKLYAPFFLKHTWLMPMAYIWRILKIDRKKLKLFKKEFKTVRKM